MNIGIYLVALCGAVTITTALNAQEPSYSGEPVQSCLQEAVSQSESVACIGVSSGQCIDAPSNGGGSYVESFCFTEELAIWDSRLNATYQRQMNAAATDNPEYAEALRALQRSWIVYRDARCDAVFAAWGEGTGRSPALMECLMQATAEQTLFLEGGH